MHGLLFFTSESEHVLESVAAAAAAVEPGALVVFTFNASLPADPPHPQVNPKGMMGKYGVAGADACPFLVFLDQRLPEETTNRQVPFDGELSEAGVRAFLQRQGLPARAAAEKPAHDEL